MTFDKLLDKNVDIAQMVGISGICMLTTGL